MKQVFVVYETDAWHTIANRDCKGIYTSKRSAINAIVKNHEIDLEEIFEDDRMTKPHWLIGIKKRLTVENSWGSQPSTF